MTDARDVELPISMLWESADPAAALGERFGFWSAAEAVDWVAGVLADHWGLRVDACERLVLSDANCLAWIVVEDRRMIAKWSMRQPVFARLAAIARLTSWLDERGVPVSAPRPTTDGRVQIEVDGFSLGLQNVIDGDLLDITDPAQVQAAGEMLATMHAMMADYPGAVPTDDPKTPRTQLVGGDFRSANVLWADGRIAAVLDLEEVRYGRRVDDLAQAAVLLGTRYHDWAPTPVGVRGAFVAAYESVLPLGKDEADALEDAIEDILRRMDWPG
ncbi:phosphotransferase enzyme family protein [Nocardioides albus]|uniref:Homoserine kinase type II n=1 Tax=Nocardioides albus TaxID=1841 RepID=A0A7W5A5V2_9ACTN|nr:phosphotransferase [Nocardioides albus]MBB3090217.1 homoserine kinase type II [Nocardioides albus]GGU28568.1 homoserine kinase type II (protein kinase fold) [Nocardioides albus]